MAPRPMRKQLTTTTREVGGVSELQGIARFKFHAGKVKEFKRLSAQCMEIGRTKDTGTVQYDIYLNGDQSEAMVLERYMDSEALIEHSAHLGDIGRQSLRRGRSPASSLVSRAQS